MLGMVGFCIFFADEGGKIYPSYMKIYSCVCAFFFFSSDMAIPSGIKNL